jgi:hypothetical protein
MRTLAFQGQREKTNSRIDAEALIKQAAETHETIGTIGTSARVGTGFVQIVVELLYRFSGLKVSVVYRVPDGLNGLNCLNEQRLIADRFGSLDKGLVSRDRRAIPQKIETEPKIRK